MLIAAFAARADLLVLDEPTSGLDPLMEQTFRECMAEAKGRGQTVFLSSHILSEVEAVADRVAILREGELVEAGTMDELRIASSLNIEITFATKPPALGRVAGVQNLAVDGKRVRCHVTGPMQPLLSAIAGHKVVELLSREPSLEELFLAHYGHADTRA